MQSVSYYQINLVICNLYKQLLKYAIQIILFLKKNRFECFFYYFKVFFYYFIVEKYDLAKIYTST